MLQSTLKNRLLEAQHKVTVMEKELKRTQELEEQLKRTQELEEQAQSYLETKLTQVSSNGPSHTYAAPRSHVTKVFPCVFSSRYKTEIYGCRYCQKNQRWKKICAT
jgi:hypothetical protein